MPLKLSTTVKSISSIPNPTNAALLGEFYEYMKSNSISENYQNGNLKILTYFARFLGAKTGFYDINKKKQIVAFLNTRIKDSEVDPDKRWIRTWNDYLQRIKYFFRWLLNYKQKASNGDEILSTYEWITPAFAQIKEKRTKRLSPYLESDAALNIINNWLSKCAKSRQLDQNFDYTVEYALKYSAKNGHKPIKYHTLKLKNNALYDLLSA